jgi:hypothetical protein
MAKKEYLTFVGKLEDLTQGKELELLIKDLTPGRRKYDARYVRAVVQSDPRDLPEGDVLWIRGFVGVLYPQPWAIRITHEGGEFPSNAMS